MTLLGPSFISKIIKHVKPNKNANILEMACGKGDIAHYIVKKRECNVIGLDISTFMIRKARERVIDIKGGLEFIVADAGKLPFRNNCLDIVISAFGISFLKKLDVLKELRRVLKKGGRCAFVDIVLKKDLPLTVKEHPICRQTCICTAESLEDYISKLTDYHFRIIHAEIYDYELKKLLEHARNFEAKISRISEHNLVFTSEEIEIIRSVLGLYIKALEENSISYASIIASK